MSHCQLFQKGMIFFWPGVPSKKNTIYFFIFGRIWAVTICFKIYKAEKELKIDDIQQGYLGSLRVLLILSVCGLSMAETLEILTWNCMIQVTVYILGQ